MKKAILSTLVSFSILTITAAQDHRFDLILNTPSEIKVKFTVSRIDDVTIVGRHQ